MANNTVQQEKRNAMWTDHTVDIFCDLCIKEIGAGGRPTTHLSSKGYENLGINFTKETNLVCTRIQFKNKWDHLKKQWKLWKELVRKETGLGWDPVLKTIDAPDDWWRNKIQKNPEYAKLRKKGINPELEEKLGQMFEHVTATGENAWAPSSGVLPPDSEDAFINVEDFVEIDDLDSPIEITETSLGKRKRTPTELGVARDKKRKVIGKGKVGGAAKLSLQIEAMAASIKNRPTLTQALKELKEGVAGTTIADVMKVVKSIPGCEQRTPLWYFASKLFLNQEKREMFMTIEDDVQCQIEWLYAEMGSQMGTNNN